MYLKALTLHGFKSFADPTTLGFEPGVTAVVGPNGCGKSNIADAIRWVLGEQSAKALRGGRMQDVIFEGVDTRKPAQICEVSLLLTDCEKQLGSEFHEIEIMRRVHRDGAGEYFFNGQPCRLKDVQKLFMDTGVGRTSYSIMAQGQIDQILSSKPEERRAVFEEAAGITKYKSQRREAMGKLALTDQNLARVSDIIGEVGRQIGSLRRQAAKAVRYKRLSHRLRYLSLAASTRQHAELAGILESLERRVTELRAAAAERKGRLEERQSALDSRKAERSRLNQRVQEAQQGVFDVRSQKEQAENGARLAQVRRSGLEERLAASRDNLSELEMQLREVSAQVDSGVQDKQMQLGLLGSSDDVFQQRSRELAIVDGRVAKLDQDLQQARFELLQQESAVARLRTDCSGYEVDQKTSLHRRDAMAADLARAQSESAVATEAAAAATTRAEAALADKTRAGEEVAAAQTTLANLTREFREAQRQLQDIDRQLAQRTARLRVLQQLQERWEGFGDGAKAVMQGRLDAALAGSKAVPIMLGLDVKPEFARAVEALLGSAVEAIAVADVGTARRILGELETGQIGSVVLRVGGLGGEAGAAELPPGLVPAIQALERADDNHPALALLASSYVAEDFGAFLEFWQSRPEFNFLAVASRKGELADRRGVVAGGHSNPKKHAQSLVQREIDLRETGRALVAEQKQHEIQKGKVDGIGAALAAAEQALEASRQAQLTASQTAAAVQAEQRTAERLKGEAAARAARMEQERAGLEQSFQEAQVRWARAQEGLATAEAAAAAVRDRQRNLDTEIGAVRTERDVKRESLAQARLELAERRQKVEVLDRGLGEMERRRQQLVELLVQRRGEIEVWTEQSAELERDAAKQAEQAGRLEETLKVAQAQVEAIRAELVGIEHEIDGLEATQAQVRAEAEAAHDELGAQEIKLAEDRQRAQFLREDALREFQADLTTLDWRVCRWRADDEPEQMQVLDLDDETEGEPLPPPPALPGAEPAEAEGEPTKARARARKPKAPRGDPTEADLAELARTDWDAVRAEVDALRQRLGSMGAVNLVAIEEYAELKQRHDFLRAQCDDLTRARAELLQAIDEINRTSQEQFGVTFEQIRKNFAYTFQTLFGGGRAELELIQTEDILESGIEIVAQPPGTKLKSITLLSGGQKTLTAVALLFALYMVKPSPFCLLDELDAPLDESNIERFTKLLGKFVQESQFIIITHNKRTVAAATAIYGVTMEERGVSKTVSMRFNQERGEIETQQPTIAESVTQAQPPIALSTP